MILYRRFLYPRTPIKEKLKSSNFPCNFSSFENISICFFCAHTHSWENNKIEVQISKMIFRRRDDKCWNIIYAFVYLLILNYNMNSYQRAELCLNQIWMVEYKDLCTYKWANTIKFHRRIYFLNNYCKMIIIFRAELLLEKYIANGNLKTKCREERKA